MMSCATSLRTCGFYAPLVIGAALAAAGCGKPPAGAGGPPDDFAVSAVIAEAREETVQVTAALVGGLQARDAVDLVSEINARVEAILFTEGESVSAGQALVRLDDTKLKAQYTEAEARFALAETNFKRTGELLANQTISQQEFDQAKAEYTAAEATLALLASDLEDAVITAPFDGVVSERRVSLGQYLTVGTPVTRLVRLEPLEVAFEVPERYAGRIAAGQAVRFATVALPGRILTGGVFFVDTLLDETTRSVLAKAEVANADRALKPGMVGTLDLVLDSHPGIVIPESAVRYAGDQASVVVMNAEDRAEFRNVTVGERLPGMVEIREGLAAGERVVVEGFQKMGPGTKIMISPESAAYGIEAPEGQG